MSVGRMYAQKRLQRKNIFCIAPRSINVSGSIDCVCFDKTGTLTEDGLDMYGVVPKTATNTLQIPLKQIERLQFDHLLFGMVTCHSITLMKGEMKGDPLDLKMFESTGWKLEEANVSDDTKYDLLFPTVVKPPSNTAKGSQNQLSTNPSEQQLDALEFSHDIGIVREFSFTSSLQRMAVITRKISDKHFNVYCKGSPEMIATLCRPETIPTDFNEKLNYYAQQGYRIISLAYKSLDRKMTYPKIQRISRDKVESDLVFLGFVILENRLKPDSEQVIKILNDAAIRTVMITGDNILTAVSVAKDCDLVTDDQSIIIVNSRWKNDEEPELFYTLEGHSTSATATNNNNMILATPASIGFINDTIDGVGDGKYKIITNSNSASSLETAETNTLSGVQRDLEKAQPFYNNVKKKKTLFNDDLNPYRLAPDLPSNRYRFAMDGKTWAIVRDYYPDLLPKFVTRGSIFARMSPDQKQQLITELQDLGYYVAMCGDGANDCGALKVAHTGISLSDAESSVASPFTSRDRTIACVPAIIQEGRTALVTSFGIFKYMAAYSLVQFTSVIILYTIDSNLTDMQFLYIDLFMISVFAFFFGRTESYDGPLVKQTPLNSLIALSPVVSLALHLIASVIILIIGWFHVQHFEWFQPFEYEDSDKLNQETLGCHQNFTIFGISCFQYMTLAIVFSKGAPYRKSIFSNKGLLLSLALNFALTCYLILYPAEWIIDFMELFMPPREYMLGFGMILLAYGLINFTVAMLIEEVIIEWFIFKKLRYRFHDIEKSHKKFLSIENYLRLNTKWPPLSLYNNQENNSPSDEESKGCNSVASKGVSNSKDDDDDDLSPMSYAEISIEPVEDDGAVVFDRNSSILNSFFERERQRVASVTDHQGSSPGDGHEDNVFQTGDSIRKKNEQLKREYLELKLTDTAKPQMMSMNGPASEECRNFDEIFQNKTDTTALGSDEADDAALVELKNMQKT